MNYHSWLAPINSFLLGYDSMGSTHKVWKKFSHLFANKTRSSVINLKERLILTKHETRLVARYLRVIKEIVNKLAIIKFPISDNDLIIHVLNGPNFKFKEISIIINACELPISFEELHNMLVDFEQFLKRKES
ncbi:hypothetical protein EUGRSUZ_L00647 [Eucalyptus grandis]|uniref:Uncharacterized protein n=2 Tax=Eucalyptus grandis TaxID=71139 RepID=A0ACC3JKP8_EUCGR|nr:hypothetical protein EUGRSUZ_L00647 [Eucalyptus grandis]